MAVSIAVNQIGTGTTFNIQLSVDEETERVSEEEQRDTMAALFGFIDEKARSDMDLREEEETSLRLRQVSDSDTASGQKQKQAELVGKRIRAIGDEFMAQFLSEPGMKDLVEASMEDTDGNPSPQSTYDHFCAVVKNVFECDVNGIAKKITLGRIAGVFAYCYYLCRTFVQRHALQGVAAFLGTLAGFLIRCLLRARFYEWLQSMGGWNQLLALTGRVSLPGLQVSTDTLLLVGAAVLLGVWLYNRFTRN